MYDFVEEQLFTLIKFKTNIFVIQNMDLYNMCYLNLNKCIL